MCPNVKVNTNSIDPDLTPQNLFKFQEKYGKELQCPNFRENTNSINPGLTPQNLFKFQEKYGKSLRCANILDIHTMPEQTMKTLTRVHRTLRLIRA